MLLVSELKYAISSCKIVAEHKILFKFSNFIFIRLKREFKNILFLLALGTICQKAVSILKYFIPKVSEFPNFHIEVT